MASLTLSYTGIFDRFALPSLRRSDARDSRPRPDLSPEEDARSRREFVREMLTRAPEAFSSELDVQTMMHFYSGRF